MAVEHLRVLDAQPRPASRRRRSAGRSARPPRASRIRTGSAGARAPPARCRPRCPAPPARRARSSAARLRPPTATARRAPSPRPRPAPGSGSGPHPIRCRSTPRTRTPCRAVARPTTRGFPAGTATPTWLGTMSRTKRIPCSRTRGHHRLQPIRHRRAPPRSGWGRPRRIRGWSPCPTPAAATRTARPRPARRGRAAGPAPARRSAPSRTGCGRSRTGRGGSAAGPRARGLLGGVSKRSEGPTLAGRQKLSPGTRPSVQPLQHQHGAGGHELGAAALGDRRIGRHDARCGG